jgi:hypothetical protein
MYGCNLILACLTEDRVAKAGATMYIARGLAALL